MIQKIRLRQFRSYLDREFSFSSGVNIISGPNASGKTNLLEAVMFACLGSSYRAPDSELIMHSKHWSRIDAQTSVDSRTVKLDHHYKPTKQFVINNKPYRRLSSNTQLPIVLFEPNHLLMLSGPPELRRNYLDGILELIKPGFQKTRREYMRTLRQRNILLRKGKVSSAELFPWNVRLSHLGGEIARLRAELTLGLNKKVKNVYSALSGTAAKIDLIYKSGVEIGSYENHLLKKLESDLEIDLMRGFTGSGPHREDLEVLINQKTPSAAASRGEARMLVIALKILEVDKLEQCLDKRAIILMDDVFGELDRERSTTLTRYLSGHQSLITTTESSLKNDSSSNIITS